MIKSITVTLLKNCPTPTPTPNNEKIALYQEKIALLHQGIRAHYPFAIFSLLSVVLGIIVLFIGFNHWTYPEMLFGLVLLSPVFLINDSPSALIRFRKDIDAENEVLNHKRKIAILSIQLDSQKKVIQKLETQRQLIFPDLGR